MATEVVHIIDPDAGTGYDYDSLYDWEAGEQGDLTGARDEIAVAKCRCTGGTADTTAVTIDGWTTSATQYIKIWTDPAESYRHNGTWQTGNKYRIDNSAAVSTIYNRENYVWIFGLQIGLSYNGNISCITNFGSAAAGDYSLWIGESIIRCNDDDNQGIINEGYGDAIIAWNCIIYKPNGTAQSDGDEGFISARGDCYLYNCTIFNFNDGVEQDGGTIYCKNCAVFGCGDDFDGLTAGNIDNCASDDGDGDNAVNISPGVTEADDWAGHFVDYANGDFHLKATSNLIGAGTNLYNDATYPFQDDIDGDDRGGSGASWDIGADEYVGASAVPKIMLLQDHFSGGIH